MFISTRLGRVECPPSTPWIVRMDIMSELLPRRPGRWPAFVASAKERAHRCEWPERNCGLVAGARLFGDFRKRRYFGLHKCSGPSYCPEACTVCTIINIYTLNTSSAVYPLYISPRCLFLDTVTAEADIDTTKKFISFMATIL